MSKPRKTLEHAIGALADQIENGHLLASTGGEDLLIAAAEKIEILQKANTTLLARTEKAEAELAELKNRLCSRCHGTGWISESDGGGVCGCDVGDTLARAHAENNALRTRAEKAEAEAHKSWDLAVSSARKHNAARNDLARLQAQKRNG